MYLVCEPILSPFELPSVPHDERPYDERPLPALERRDSPPDSAWSPAEEHQPQASSLGSPYISGEPEPLSEKVQREAGHALHVFGDTIVRFFKCTLQFVCTLKLLIKAKYICFPNASSP